jgi:hypothetical protein
MKQERILDQWNELSGASPLPQRCRWQRGFLTLCENGFNGLTSDQLLSPRVQAITFAAHGVSAQSEEEPKKDDDAK